MNTIETLLNRRSSGRLSEPGPTAQQLEILIRCASRAADHGNLKPWRFLLIEGDDRKIFAKSLLDVAMSNDPDLAIFKQEKILAKPFRAPTILVAISKNIEHSKIPVFEQELATAAAVQNLLNAAFDMKVGAYWRTGAAAFSEPVKASLQVKKEEAIVGFIYLGSADFDEVKRKSTDDWADCLQVGLSKSE